MTETVSGVDPAYRRLPTVGPHAPKLGAALITWVEPNPANVVEYNRWYEDDHMITGAMVMPWMFSCRRFVAPTFLQPLRYPATSRVVDPLEKGKYIGIYWINEGRLDDHEQWALGANYRLHAEGRGTCTPGGDPSVERTHVLTNFNDYLGATVRDGDVPADVHALVDPAAGLVVELVEATDGHTRDELDAWLAHEYLPALVTRPGSPVMQALRFAPRPLPGDKLSHVRSVDDVDRIITILYFCDRDPREMWDTAFVGHNTVIDAGGIGRLDACVPFIATKHGTNVYTDDLF
jgi:hypothetical protein